jgi:hypothetical protein
MNLAQGGGRERHRIKTRERLRDSDSQLRRYDLFHLGKGKGFDLVLKSRERLQIRFWQQVRPAGKHLAQLHVSGSHRFEVIGQLIRRGLSVAGRLQCLRINGLVDAHLLHEIGAAVFPQQQSNFFVTFEMVG